ncbi:MAG: esterase [Micavibrio aeruginosavorus]|uniref:Esterase n=1 Tax=Micavibrio aeruginosavorus TaxID=349221 RepID=A0A2W5FB28_9BACT|nr:MAG: esterase [Micavibrio aeruginosavorus]
MKTIFGLLGLSLAFLISACTQINMAVVNAPTHFGKVKSINDVAFGAEKWQRLDIYIPPNAAENKKLPVIVFYYGGRWQEGSKNYYKFVGSALAKQGYIVVIPDYRKYPEVKFPAFVEDGAQSLSWIYDHIGEYGGNKNEIQIAGHSAGAHIAALLTTDERYLKHQGKDRSKVIKKFVGLAGPYDFVPYEDDLKDMFGPPSNYPQMQATTFVDGRQPPMLLLWGEKDQYVGKFNMDKLAERIRVNGGCVKTKIYPGVDHIWLLGDLSWLSNNKHGVLKDWINDLNMQECR